MFRFFPLIWLPVFLVVSLGCHFNRAFVSLSPSQILSGERSRAGIAAKERGDLAEAEKRLEEAVKLSKKDIYPRRHYAEVLWQLGKYEESLRQLNEAVKLGGGDDASLHISLAEKHLAMQRYPTAFSHANEAVRLASQDYHGWALRGRAGGALAKQFTDSDAQEMLNQAKNDYLRAISLAPNDRELLPELAVTQMRCGQPEQALATWLSLQNSFPQGAEPTDFLHCKADTLAALQRFDEAAACLNVIRQREPERPDIEQRYREILAQTQKKTF
jgi:tetratricopeptide (TPR) repeat protein